MQHFVWKPEYEVHVPFMDDEHRELAAKLNALFLPMSRGEAKEVLAPLLDALVQHTAAHFESEEQAFSRYAYPGAATHHAVHTELLEKVCHLQAEFLAGRQQLTLTAMQFLKVWLVEHIGKEDRAFADFLRQRSSELPAPGIQPDV